MRLDEGYRILGVSPRADIEEIKSAYRRQAFALHPDLNPDDPSAKRRFQKLNEAYLLVKHAHQERPETSPPPPGGDGPQARGQRFDPGPESRPGGATGPSPGYQKHRGQEAYRRAAGSSGAQTGFYFRREEVLQDLLKDPFARQVFQDIYRQVRSAGRGVTPLGKKELTFKWGERAFSLDLTKGLWGNIKSWFFSQLDDEQTVTVPGASLMPGARIRVGIRHGVFTQKPITVEVTLPGDYLPGRPLRLRGMGRRFGPWKGDLYLRIVSK
ncbi:DnaJ domain-containing protein [Desulfovibrio sulfodismutans]|uniref:DnaJ domain-containing protein n=1 Tax=Desulfolutivibrio sulfodismutans TaxID=63561 RepID=A0A7K3NGN3_9BACT|nr:DnaJ domain-containing protein [Desulfolutivibrio sulfodismutans]NDY55354.1 DnaJ domain-containing protein [Desulfolutivibrio sulfodismutans]QLA11055.1 DnaJ domain-containing protein [Desulfolutivibrio sulfodismutans DSM 3696]